MAAAIVPIAASLAPAVIDLIAGLVHRFAPAAESNLGPKTGPVKFTQVFGDVLNALQQAAGSGQIDKQLPPDDTIKAVIQAVVTSMKLGGSLETPLASVSAIAPGRTVTITGQAITITVN